MQILVLLDTYTQERFRPGFIKRLAVFMDTFTKNITGTGIFFAVASYQTFTLSFSSLYILSPGLMPNAL